MECVGGRTDTSVLLNGSCGTPDSTAAGMTDDLLTAQVVAKTGVGAAADTSNLVFNELRRSGVVDGSRTNRELAIHSNGDVFQVGSTQQASGAGLIRANVIIMYGIPVWLAEAIDAAIDGSAADYNAATAIAGPASNGRVRRWDGNVTVTGVASATFAPVRAQYNDSAALNDKLLTRDDLVSISFQFDTIKLIDFTTSPD
jgi:hypothetical protein